MVVTDTLQPDSPAEAEGLADSTGGSAPASAAVAAEGSETTASGTLLSEASRGDSSGKRKS